MHPFRTLSWSLAIAATLLSPLVRADDDKGHYRVTPLVSDGALAAPLTDAKLVNAWGLAASPTGPWWVANNGTASATLYSGSGVKSALEVNVPGAPTGEVWNGQPGWALPLLCSGRAVFMWSSEDGTISGWNPSNPTQACVAIDDSAQGNVFKGLALATDKNWIYATDFHNSRIEVYDALWADAPNAGFVNPKVAQGYAPFGIAYLDGHIFVTYAKQGAGAKDDVSGHGHGFVAEFDTDGNLLCQVAEHGELNSPWGLAMAPSDFGRFGGHLLVGNFGDGRINAFERGHDEHGRCHWRHRGALHGTKGKLEVDGLWSIGFGNDHASGSHNTLYFSAGPNGEANGLFGAINWTPK